ncbi:hypothetical protein Droror1_Dr00015464 [Drosera rotundifolia]
MPRKKKIKDTIIKLPHQLEPCNFDCFEGERLSYLLESIKKELEVERDSNKRLPDKLWLKQQFAVGLNEVTRVLERMPPSVKNGDVQKPGCGFSIRLQVVFVAWDCNPRWLIRHLPSLAASRDVPIFFVKDHKQGSIRLGELVGTRTAIAVGIKVKGSRINNVVGSILSGVELTSAEKFS